MNALIEWCARHPVAANLLMGFMVIGGIVSLSNTTQKIFPEFTLDVITVEVPYIGAAPEEIEQSIVQPLEQQLQSIEGLKETTATAAEGVGVVSLEFQRGTDIARALNDAKSEVDRITIFPDEAEEPIVSQASSKTRVAEIALYGDIPEATLRELAYKMKDDLVLSDAISLVEVTRARDYEMSIEVSRDTLRAYELTLADLSAAVRRESLELPGGDIDTDNENILVRTLGRNLTRQDFEEIIIRTSAQDGVVRIKDVATVIDGFEERSERAIFDGKPAVFLQVYRVGDERVLDLVGAAKDYLENTLNPALPEGVKALMWRNDARELEARIGLLAKNAVIGLLLVALALTLFLDLRLALWVAAGIGVSFIGAFIVMGMVGISINQLSMFGFILAIGIVVDDAIVVGENIFSAAERGASPVEAAVRGAQRVAGPVLFAVATTITAFVPLLFLPGVLGKFLGDIPAVVIIILGLSLVESLLILPRHLAHIDIVNPPRNFIFTRITRVRNRVDGVLQRFIDGPLERTLSFTTRHWFVSLAGALTTLALAMGLLANGYIKFEFFPQIEGQYVTASIEMPDGTSLERTRQIVDSVQRIGQSVAGSFSAEFADGDDVVKSELVLVGAREAAGGPAGGAAIVLPKVSEGSVVVELIEPAARTFSAAQYEARWREALKAIDGSAKVSVASNIVSLGFPIQVEVSAESDAALRDIITRTEDGLAAIEGVYDVRNDFDSGKREFKIELRDEARRYGLTLQSLAGQVRAGFFGDEALRVQRGRDEIRVYVRLPQAERRYLSDLYDYRIATGDGVFVPLNRVATIKEGLSPATINRRNGRRVITITADVDSSLITGQEANTILRESILPDIRAAVPGAAFDFGGEAREMAEVGAVLGRNFGLALFVIFALLAISFRSYVQPIVVMLAIPFGLVGAVVGHLVMGLSMGLLSIFGLVGLAGVVINGALVQVDFANEMRRSGMDTRKSWVAAGKSRFRPIFLTALTTFLGVGPLMLEQSIQAQFLIPMAASIAFGVLIGTGIQMLVVPAVGAMLDDLGLARIELDQPSDAQPAATTVAAEGA